MAKNNQLTPKQQKGCAIGCLSIIAVIALVIAIAVGIDGKNKKDKENAAEKALDTSLPMEERIENAAIGALGEKNNMDDARNIKVEETSKNTYTISFLADENMTTKLQVSTLESDITDVLEALKLIDGIQAVVIQAQSKFVDKYGNEKIDNALNVSITKSEIDKINFKNFVSSNLKNIAKYNLHPAFNK